mmetsp:Transcript_34957/g.108198  ORF Transcript_34957/g.108198 Transcript_34957/m.108198 type:complete len:228 (+) Transcript_34957:785-1468(+)
MREVRGEVARRYRRRPEVVRLLIFGRVDPGHLREELKEKGRAGFLLADDQERLALGEGCDCGQRVRVDAALDGRAPRQLPFVAAFPRQRLLRGIGRQVEPGRVVGARRRVMKERRGRRGRELRRRRREQCDDESHRPRWPRAPPRLQSPAAAAPTSARRPRGACRRPSCGAFGGLQSSRRDAPELATKLSGQTAPPRTPGRTRRGSVSQAHILHSRSRTHCRGRGAA